jgi:Yeast PIR protein repeat
VCGSLKRERLTVDSGQPQAPTAPAISQISDGQPQVASAVSQISDGQPQAPSAPAVSQIPDGQPQAPTYMMAPVSMIIDGQIQGGMHTMTMMPVSQIADGQPQAPTMVTMAPVTVISDGQPQAPVFTAAPVTQIADGQPQATTAAPVSQMPDGQPQASTAAPVSQITDGQPQASTGTPVTEATDAQPQAPTASDSAPDASGSPGTSLVACRAEGTLELTLNDGVLKDAQGRTGYIASNYQFQFDAPPQAGAIYTSGFSVCGNGSLALGGSNVFYQCLSGSFYNLYDRDWAPQCSPVTIETLTIQNCD